MFFTGLALLSTLTSVQSLSCISINNQECKVRPQIVTVNSNEPFNIRVIFLLALTQVSAVVVVTILIIHMQKYVFLML